MNRGKHNSSTSTNYPQVSAQRYYVQYVLETVWAVAVGAAGGHWLSRANAVSPAVSRSRKRWSNRTEPGGSRGLDDYLVRDFHRNIGAEIMGRNKFGPQRGPWADDEWQGWWGRNRRSTPRCSS